MRVPPVATTTSGPSSGIAHEAECDLDAGRHLLLYDDTAAQPIRQVVVGGCDRSRVDRGPAGRRAHLSCAGSPGSAVLSTTGYPSCSAAPAAASGPTDAGRSGRPRCRSRGARPTTSWRRDRPRCQPLPPSGSLGRRPRHRWARSRDDAVRPAGGAVPATRCRCPRAPAPRPRAAAAACCWSIRLAILLSTATGLSCAPSTAWMARG